MELLSEVNLWLCLVIIVSAFITGILHGATGMLGGIVMTALLSQIIGIKQAVPVMTCALLFSHTSRLVIYWKNVDWPITARVLIFGSPSLIFGAYLFSILDPRIIAFVFACFLIFSIPMKYYARQHNIKTGPKLLSFASAIWGMLAGNVVGPGFFLAPFLLGTGINRLAFVGTMAAITLVMNSMKLAVFGSTDILNIELLIIGAVVGLCTVPGNWLGKRILQKLSDDLHRYIVDSFTVLVIFNFLYLAFG
tara:strand:+ start:3838 stop:4587 length:750 start_codon:yes stop_codon:yes gene_type:complete